MEGGASDMERFSIMSWGVGSRGRHLKFRLTFHEFKSSQVRLYEHV